MPQLLAQALQAKQVVNFSNHELTDRGPDIRKLPIIAIHNVMDYIKSHADKQNNFHLPAGVIAPPLPEFWMEYGYTAGEGRCLRYGVFCKEKQDPWRIEMELLLDADTAPLVVYMGSATYYLSDDGRSRTTDFRFLKPPDMAPEKALKEEGQNLIPFCLGLMFMHCKNVKRVEHVPPPALAKRNRERGKPFMLKYHTLEIEGLKTILKREGQIETVGLERALHICRGHFAHYAESGPGLFGRGIHGDFWIPAHVRGTEKKGVVVSDYDVKPPKEPL